ncbi:LysM peptidoglycan-binding domain-containing protein [Guptibacillus hwajinpoensis]|uniref:Spore germination protein YaaH n=1 Tax=Guptibacillus hwajinpoensis TaxID=208199 RepID=A0ABU0K2E4_9BACL|nr:LysM peptidoglycan-binding domain-containing protein [Alkalihalobacillus hemicentroti]MDQ0483449.1 spore germination protein YaaH [Alkalihalobacillus hemicentroti]
MPQSQYFVKPGDTLLNIAETHDRSVQQIRQLNNLNSNIIYVGQMLRIPTSTATYTVQQGDTLLTISDRFQVPVDEVKELNQLQSNLIYVGQHLDIPSTRNRMTRIDYTVKSGDSLYQIANNYKTTAKSIMTLNNLSSDALTIGQTLKIPVYSEAVVKSDRANVRTGPGKGYNVITQVKAGAKFFVEGIRGNWFKVKLYDGTNGWISDSVVTFNAYGDDQPVSRIIGYYTLEEGPSLPSSYKSFVSNRPELSQLALFLFRISESNPTTIEKFGKFSNREIEKLVQLAHDQNIKVMPVVHNLLYKKGDTEPSKKVVQTLVSSEENRRAFALNLVKLIEKYNFDGVDIDIEDVYIEDSEKLSLLYKAIGEELHKKGYFFSASVPSRASDEPVNPFSDPFDYAEIGKHVDQFIVMLYNEFGWPGSPAGPAVTAGWMEKVMTYAKTRIPPEKLVSAISVFGFDFNLDEDKSTYVTYDMAMKLKKKYKAEVQFNEERKTPFFTYEDEEGNKHEVWFENEQSIEAKTRLADELGVQGVALWRLGMEDPAIWSMFKENIVIDRTQ